MMKECSVISYLYEHYLEIITLLSVLGGWYSSHAIARRQINLHLLEKRIDFFKDLMHVLAVLNEAAFIKNIFFSLAQFPFNEIEPLEQSNEKIKGIHGDIFYHDIPTKEMYSFMISINHALYNYYIFKIFGLRKALFPEKDGKYIDQKFFNFYSILRDFSSRYYGLMSSFRKPIKLDDEEASFKIEGFKNHEKNSEYSFKLEKLEREFESKLEKFREKEFERLRNLQEQYCNFDTINKPVRAWFFKFYSKLKDWLNSFRNKKQKD